MVHREIEIDEETDRKLTGIAEDYDGDLGKALAELVAQHDGMEALLEETERINHDHLLQQRERAEQPLNEVGFTAWKDVIQRNKS